MDMHGGQCDCQWYLSCESRIETYPWLTPLFWLLNPPTEVPWTELLFFLPPSARANHSNMGDPVDREVAMSWQDKEVETEAARQAHYIFWCSLIGIPDPCGAKFGYQCIVAIYAKYVMSGINYYNKDVLRSSTLHDMLLPLTPFSTFEVSKNPLISQILITWPALSLTTKSRRKT